MGFILRAQDGDEIVQKTISETGLRECMAAAIVTGVNASQMIEGEESLKSEEFDELLDLVEKGIPARMLVTS